MRRALLTTASRAVPITIGRSDNFANAADAGFSRVVLELTTPASGTGTLTTANVAVVTAGSLAVMTGSLSGTTYTVRAISSAQSLTSGVHSIPISLAVQAGDYIGIWSSGASLAFLTSGPAKTGNYATANSPTSAPAPGAALSIQIGAVSGLIVGIGGAG